MKKHRRNLQKLGSSLKSSQAGTHRAQTQPGTLILGIHCRTFLGAVKMLHFLLTAKATEKQ